MPLGRNVHYAAALAAVLSNPMVTKFYSPSDIKAQFAKSLNGGSKGHSVKASARTAAKRRSIKRARRLGHA